MLSTPLLWPSRITPFEEVEAIKTLYAHLVGLEYSVQAWEAALELYKTAKNPPLSISSITASRWRFIACNECILELYHLQSRFKKIQSILLRSCPSLRNSIDVPRMRSARKMLNDHFPGIEALRHAVAHKGENEAHPEVHVPYGKYTLAGFHEIDRFSAPHEGKVYFLDITNQSLQKISEATSLFIEAFQVAAHELKNQGYLE